MDGIKRRGMMLPETSDGRQRMTIPHTDTGRGHCKLIAGGG